MKPARISFLLLGLILLGSLVFNYRPNLSRAQTDQSSSKSCCSEVAPRQLEFPYYSLRDGFQSTMYLVSASPQPQDLVVAIHGRTGQTVLAPGMTIQPQEKLAVNLAALLTNLSADVAGDFSEGSVSLYFSGTIMPVAGQLTMTNPARALSFESELVDNSPGLGLLPKQLNGLWWGIGGGRDARIMVSNSSGATASADVFLDFQSKRHASAPLTFAPHETKVLSITELLGDLKASPAQVPEGGITIVPRDVNPSLVAEGRITDPVTGFSTSLNFLDPSLQLASALHASGVPIGLPSKNSPYVGLGFFTPHVIVRNLAGGPQSVTITLEYPGADGPQQKPLAPLSLGPYSSADVSLTSALGLLPGPLPYCSIRIQYTGAPGTVIGEVASVEARQDMVIDGRLANEGDGWAGSGANPWHLDDETESVTFVTNMSDREVPLGFQVQAGGVPFYLTDLGLKPHETRAIDMRKLRDAQKADIYGKRMPADASDGSVMWIRGANVPVMGRTLVLRRQGGLASSYSCVYCPCPYQLCTSLLSVLPSNVTVGVGGTQQYDYVASYNDCNGHSYTHQQQNRGPQSYYWSSSPTSVASISVVGLATGTSGGTATITAGITDCACWNYSFGTCTCTHWLDASGSTALNVVSGPITVNLGPPPSTRSSSFSAGDNLSFAGFVSCGDRLGALACNRGWFWQEENAGTVSDGAPNWRVTQDENSRTYTINYNDGTHSTTTTGYSRDNPNSGLVQKTAGTTKIFWLDSPGPFYYSNITSIDDQSTKTSRICSTKTPGMYCVCVDWKYHLIGGNLGGTPTVDTSNSSASITRASYPCQPQR